MTLSVASKLASADSGFLIDEYGIGRTLGFTPPPVRVFSLEKLGINQAEFLAFLRPTFSVLQPDPYDGKRSKVEFLKKYFPAEADRLDRFIVAYYAEKEGLDSVIDLVNRLINDDRNEFDRIGLTGLRKRSIARFYMHLLSGGTWEIRRVPASKFKQSVGKHDTRSLVRVFAEAPEFVTDHPDMRRLMNWLADTVRGLRPDAKVLEMNLHQMFIFADLMSAGENAPEGIHQDGSDFIVSALVIERAGITGGESIVYGPDKKTQYLRRTLLEGEGIFQADAGSPLWHYVTPIKEDPSTPPDYGHRSILGFDINIL